MEQTKNLRWVDSPSVLIFHSSVQKMEQYIVAPYVKVGIQKNKLFMGFGSIQFIVEDPEMMPDYLRTLHAFKTPRELSGLDAAIVDQLINRKFLIRSDLYDSSNRWSRQNLFFELSGIPSRLASDTLKGKKVAILGCGGIGNQVSVHLATAGVGNFILCDADTIEASNLSRQILFAESDIGELKTQVLARELKRRLGDIEIQHAERQILKTEDLDFCKHVDFIVVSADKGNVVNIVNQFCATNDIPYLNVGYVNDIAVWGPLYVPGESGCYVCQDIVAEDGTDVDLQRMIRGINRDYQAPSVGPVNMISSGLAALDILKFLVGAKDKVQSINKRIGLWTHNLKFEEQNCAKNPNCSVCQTVEQK